MTARFYWKRIINSYAADPEFLVKKSILIRFLTLMHRYRSWKLNYC